MDMKIIVLVTGESCAGKDYCANVWVSALTSKGCRSLHRSISDATKKEYAIATGSDLQRLLDDRSYKELHRAALSSFYRSQVEQRPQLPGEHFLQVVNDAGDVNVLFITGLRDDAPVATFSPLVPGNRLLEVRVEAINAVRLARGGSRASRVLGDGSRPDFIYDNSLADSAEDARTRRFAYYRLLPLINNEVRELAAMVRPVPDFPTPGINFRHVLDIVQQRDGIRLCTRLMEAQFRGHLRKMQTVVSVETGGLIFASALVQSIDGSAGPMLSIIRKQGKLPPPLLSTPMSPSHISSSVAGYPNRTTISWIQALFHKVRLLLPLDLETATEKRFEIDRNVIPQDASVLIVDDVLATGNTLCAVLGLLVKAGVDMEKTQVMVVAEFPSHDGRKLLCERGFGRVKVQSLLVFDGA